MPPLINANNTKKPRLSRIGGDSRSRQPTLFVSARARRRHACTRLVVAHSEQQCRCRKAEHAGADEGAAPTPHALHHQQAAGRHRRAEHAGEGVHRKRLADASGRHVMRQQRVIGRVVDRVADAGEREHRHQKPERVDQAGDREGAGAEQQTDDQQHARAQPVDQKSGRRLQRRRHDIEGGEAPGRFRCS